MGENSRMTQESGPLDRAHVAELLATDVPWEISYCTGGRAQRREEGVGSGQFPPGILHEIPTQSDLRKFARGKRPGPRTFTFAYLDAAKLWLFEEGSSDWDGNPFPQAHR